MSPRISRCLQAGERSESWSRCGSSAGSRARVSFRRPSEIRIAMRVQEAIAFAVDEPPAGLEIRINFGVFAGRDATTAELEELGQLLLPEAGEVSIVGEERHDLAEEVEVVVHQVRVAIPPAAVPNDSGERNQF